MQLTPILTDAPVREFAFWLQEETGFPVGSLYPKRLTPFPGGTQEAGLKNLIRATGLDLWLGDIDMYARGRNGRRIAFSIKSGREPMNPLHFSHYREMLHPDAGLMFLRYHPEAGTVDARWYS